MNENTKVLFLAVLIVVVAVVSFNSDITGQATGTSSVRSAATVSASNSYMMGQLAKVNVNVIKGSINPKVCLYNQIDAYADIRASDCTNICRTSTCAVGMHSSVDTGIRLSEKGTFWIGVRDAKDNSLLVGAKKIVVN